MVATRPRNRQWGAVGRRIGFYSITLFVVATFIFVLPRALPGDPLSALLDPENGIFLTEDARIELEAHYGLDRPLSEQYADYLGDIATLDFGTSISRQTPVSSLIAARLPWSLLLMFTSLLIASAVSWMAGVGSAWRHGSLRDRSLVATLTAARAIPEYAVAAVLLVLFAVVFPVFPVAGNRTVFGQHSSWVGSTWDVIVHLVLPVTALSLSLLGSKFLLVRNTVISTLGQDYMVLARAKGLPTRVQKHRHAGRNALLPFLSMLGVQAAFAVGGTIFVEAVFSYPGMGNLVLDAVDARDYPLLDGLFLVLALTVLVVNAIVDVASVLIDPTASRSGKSA